MFRCDDGIKGPRKRHLDWAPYLATIHPCGHDGTERSNVEEVGTHPLTSFIDSITALTFLVVAIQHVFAPDSHICALMLFIENGLFFDVNFEPFPAPLK